MPDPIQIIRDMLWAMGVLLIEVYLLTIYWPFRGTTRVYRFLHMLRFAYRVSPADDCIWGVGLIAKLRTCWRTSDLKFKPPRR